MTKNYYRNEKLPQKKLKKSSGNNYQNFHYEKIREKF